MRVCFRTMMLIVGWLLAPAVVAQMAARPAPADIGTPHLETPHGSDLARDIPIGGYTLATFWMPQHCKRAIRGIAAIDCAQPEMRASGLALHGLWPDGTGKDWPQWCKPAALLPAAVIAAHYGATPSAQQMQHEWAKHGVCLPGYSAERYFDRSDQLYRTIHVPDLRSLSYRPLTVESAKRAIIDANPGLRPEMFKLTLDKQGWLEEIWFCLDTQFARKACAEPQREAMDTKVQIWRGGRAGGLRPASQGYERRSYRNRNG